MLGYIYLILATLLGREITRPLLPEQRIKEKATELVDEYKDQMDEVTYKGAKEEIKNAKIKPQKED